ncbi:DUF3426 domain-containing protein [Geobacter sulfurreducens subsp. ethanolicus]|uniref:DUF3426 domain-containing protein n=1 Tax=Geobacter sulfurreducens TaxID=35554 RepID=UPI0025732E46|nr:DUF3426 domain-containing protein [Geobacter sulfurreducens]BEH09293.1 DUF3426 domain-containing protein [Geobacter sulfurreducens subsp. ethanolicus]
MIIQCAQCSSKFRLDDSKVTAAGIKVRCSKCRHIFVIKKEAPAEEPDFDSILQGLDATEGREASAAAVAAAQEAGKESEPAWAPQQAQAPSFTPADSDAEEAADNLAASSGIPSGPAATDEDFSFDFGGKPTAGSEEHTGQSTASEPEGFDFGGFGEDSVTQEQSRPTGPAAVSAVGGFGGEIAFGEVSPEAFAAATDAGGREKGSTGDFALEFEEGVAKEDASSKIEAEEEAEPFDFGELDLGIDETAPEPETRDRINAPAATLPEQSVAEPAATTTPSSPLVVPFGEEEAPPLVISSRRKGRSLLPLVAIVVSVLVIVALAGFGFYFFKEGPAAFNKLGIGFVAEWLGFEAREEGGIGLDKVSGGYLANAEAGEVFVIRGEAINNYRKPRASIQVKGALLGSGGQAVVQKVAYCGNSLSDEQIASLPMAKIESAMNNQFGDSLSNLGVQPGKRIPFVIVLANIPREATDFTVEVTGSTVATQ